MVIFFVILGAFLRGCVGYNLIERVFKFVWVLLRHLAAIDDDFVLCFLMSSNLTIMVTCFKFIIDFMLGLFLCCHCHG